MNSTHKHFITLLFLCISLFMPFSAGAQVNNNKKQTKKVHSSERKKTDVPDEDRHFTAGDAEYTRAVAPGVRVTFDKYNTDSLSDETITVNGVSFVMKGVRGGVFTMGSTLGKDPSAILDECPAHKVAVSSFRIGRTEVTQALWRAVMNMEPSYFKGDNLPVEQVSWNDCQAFIRKLNALTGRQFRLPTEAEWEYAARGGRQSHGYKYSGSDNADDVAWHAGNSGGTTHEVAGKKPNELGLYDMSGNVWEWCQDYYGYYGAGAQTDPKGPHRGFRRVRRGGCWYYLAESCRVPFRNCDKQSLSHIIIGLRLAM